MATSRRQDGWLDRHHGRYPADQEVDHTWTRRDRPGLATVGWLVAVVLALLVVGLIIVINVGVGATRPH
jgi:hypothetical protein